MVLTHALSPLSFIQGKLLFQLFFSFFLVPLISFHFNAFQLSLFTLFRRLVWLWGLGLVYKWRHTYLIVSDTLFHAFVMLFSTDGDHYMRHFYPRHSNWICWWDIHPNFHYYWSLSMNIRYFGTNLLGPIFQIQHWKLVLIYCRHKIVQSLALFIRIFVLYYNLACLSNLTAWVSSSGMLCCCNCCQFSGSLHNLHKWNNDLAVSDNNLCLICNYNNHDSHLSGSYTLILSKCFYG